MGEHHAFGVEIAAAGQQAIIVEMGRGLLDGEAFEEEQVRAVGDLRQDLGPFGIAGMDEDLAATFEPYGRGRRAAGIPLHLDGRPRGR